MIEQGKIQLLEVVRIDKQGLYLNAKKVKDKNDILLPKNQAPQDIGLGEEIEVFVYRAAEEGMLATVKRPKLLLGELAVLRVVDTTKFGAFLDWGLEKDLLLPVKEQVGRVVKDGSYLVGLFINSKGRLCATMKIYNFLSAESSYKENDMVHGWSN